MLPPEVAAGPKATDGYTEWETAGRSWSRDVLGNANGWWSLLPADVAERVSVRLRMRRLSEGAHDGSA